MADQEAPPTLSKGQQIAYNVGVAVNLVDRVSNSVNTMATALEKVKNLFKPFETKAQQTFNVVGQSAQAAGGGGGGGFGGIAAIAMQFNAITAAASTIWNAVTPLIGLSSQAEQTTNVLAGTFTALGFSSNIEQGLDLAAEAMARIRRESAALPGEASEYLQVFQAALPNVSGHFQNEVGRITAFTNQFSAVGRSFGIDAQQIGADLARLTQEGRGGAGMDVRTFTTMLPFINQYRQSMHQAAVTTETFNAMTQTDRINLLQNSFASLNPMITRASHSWDAMTGSIAANIQRIQIEAFAPLFDAIKDATSEFNEWLDGAADGMISVGRNVSQVFANMVGRGADAWDDLADRMRASGVGSVFSNIGIGLATINDRMSTEASGGLGTAAGMLMGGPFGAILAGGFSSFLEDATAVGQSLNSFASSLNWLLATLEPVGTMFGVLNTAVGSVFILLIPAVMYFIEAVSRGIAEFVAVVAPVVQEIIAAVLPTVQLVAGALANAARALGDVTLPALRMLGLFLKFAWESTRDYILPVVRLLGDAFTSLFNWIASFLRGIGQELTQTMVGTRSLGHANDPLSVALERLTGATADNTAAQQRATTQANRPTPAQRGGNRTHNDFRNSRFDITQRFAEGFDPDRVAVAFTEQLENAAAQRIDAGLNPLFTIPG